jgi:hypothetical protein
MSVLPAYVVVRMSADGDIIDTREFHLDAATCHAHTRQSCALGRRAGLIAGCGGTCMYD